ncbi:hypothetical protein WR25_27030 [Diploscapter pachys]|uniref:Poly [ADP-ribose] polymerase n=1 Tax=Diploscapter pachys TaxID=2018661 RepID=A0A2A2JNJ3_9BILA|nr:hypothetical protein WR25_27030 [Diploscapter pachys]
MPRKAGRGGRMADGGALKPVQQSVKDEEMDDEKPADLNDEEKQEDGQDGEEEEQLPKRRTSTRQKSGAVKRDVQEAAPRAARKRSTVKYVEDDEDEKDDEEEAPAPKKRGRPLKSNGTKATSSKAKDGGSSGVEDDEEEERTVPKKRGRKPKSVVATSSKQAAVGHGLDVPLEEEEEKAKDSDDEPLALKLDHYKSGKRHVKVKGKTAVDQECNEKVDTAHVYEEDGQPYDAMLNQTNISAGRNNNKYYLLQLLEDDNAKNYCTWFRWGRVGLKGRSELKSHLCLGDAKQYFMNKFYDKTLNDWTDRDVFVPYPDKYTLIKIDYGLAKAEQEEEDEAESLASGDESVEESKLNEKVQHLLNLLCDIRNMEHTIHELEYDSTKAPLGKLAPGQIREGFAALKEIEELLKKGKLGNALVEACNRFYTIIPHAWGMKKPPLINNEKMLKRETELLELLEDIEFAVHSFQRKKGDKRALIDQHYEKMSCQVQPLETEHDEYKLVKAYLENTHGQTHSYFKIKLHAVYKVDRHGERDKFRADFGNVKLLWHGSRLANWFSILTQGLRIAPPEAPVTGYMFGKGIYFADCVSKSANYCYPQRGGKGILVLAEVALGKPELMREANYNAMDLGVDSVKAEGKWVPNVFERESMLDDIEVPKGPMVERPESKRKPNDFILMYNEYIVYNVDQVRLRYVVEVDFDL